MLVYTAIFGRYDTLREPAVPQDAGVRFVCYTNQSPARIGAAAAPSWSIVPIHQLPFPGDPLWSARWYKLHPPEGPSCWIDASLKLERDLAAEIRAVGRPLVFMPYRKRDCVYVERKSAIGRVRDQGRGELIANIERQIKHYREIGVPEKCGLHLTGLHYRDGSPAVANLLARWWAEMRRWGSPRDQVALARVEWEAGTKFASFPVGMVRQFPHESGKERVAAAGRILPDGSITVL